MKLGTPFFILLVIALGFTSVALIVGDFRTNYPEAGNVSTENYESKYNYQQVVNGSFLDIGEKLSQIGEEESGWKRFFGTLYVLPLAVISMVLQLVFAIPYLGAILSGVANDLGVPPAIISIGIIAIIAAIIIMLVKFAHKSPTP